MPITKWHDVQDIRGFFPFVGMNSVGIGLKILNVPAEEVRNLKEYSVVFTFNTSQDIIFYLLYLPA